MTDKKYKKELTQEQIEEFWEWCGFEIKKESWIDDHYEPDGRLLTPKGKVYDGVCVFGYPLVDLNNLFKYAVPKLQPKYSIELITWREGKYKVIINRVCQGWAKTFTTEIDTDPALALFWAIWEGRRG